MTIENSTLNILLGCIASGVVWTVKEITAIKVHLASLPCSSDHCKKQKHMKKTFLSLFLLAALFACLFAMVGCTAMDKAYTKTVSSVPGPILATNTVWQTNFSIVTVTNSVGQLVWQTNVVAVPVVSYVQGAPVLVTNLAPAAAVEGGLAVVQSLPVPWAGVAGILLGWLYTGYAAIRNKKVAVALVTGIEAGRKVLQTTAEGQKLDVAIKDNLIQHQELAGVLNAVSGLVNTYTGDTVTK